MSSRSVVSPHDQRVTFVELFFDLVFVFALTQVAALLHEGLAWAVVGQAVLVFWLVWWGWTQFTWALNAADTTHPLVELGTLAATAVAFLMAVSVPGAFETHALWFAASYVAVRVIGLAIYARVASETPTRRVAVRTFSTVSAAGMVTALVGGALGGTWQLVLWGMTILLDVVAALVGGRMSGWGLHPEHFAERHGLFVIIALGEMLIAAASAVTGVVWTADLMAVGGLAVVITCGLWWSYFVRAKPALEHAMAEREDADQAQMARDVYSLLHFVMLCGLIAYTVAVEEAVAHPAEPLHLDARLALAAGLVLFVGGMAAAKWRATRRVLGARALLAVATAAVVIGVGGAAPWVSMGIALVGVVVIVAVEERLSRRAAMEGGEVAVR